MRFVTTRLALAAYLLLLLPVLGTLHAQTATGALVGVVRDASDAVVPQAAVVATNTATGVVYRGQTGGSGDYRIGNLPNGTYDVSTTVPGFAPSVLKGVAISANNVQTQDFSLVLRAAAQPSR